MSDLFETSNPVRLDLEVPDAVIFVVERAVDDLTADASFGSLLERIAWREEAVQIWGKTHLQPRLVAWHGEPGTSYSYSGSNLVPEPWNPTLLQLKQIAESHAQCTFNSVLLNLYRDENDRMGWHSDDEPSLGTCPTIASLSLGETRTFQLRHRFRPELGIRSLDLKNGSMLVMSGPTQKYWQHALRKESKPRGKRINLTFRTITPVKKELHK